MAGVLYRNFGVRDTTKHVDGVLSYRMQVLPVTSEVIRLAAVYSRDFKILPYDAIHVATATSEGVSTILSADKELSNVKTVKRLDPLAYRRATT